MKITRGRVVLAAGLFVVAAVSRAPEAGNAAPSVTAAPTISIAAAPTTPAAPATTVSPPSPSLLPPSFAATDEPAPELGSEPTGETESARVVRVVDGDTIVIDRGYGDEKVRYIGIDTPETVAPGSAIEWMGPEASAANKR